MPELVTLALQNYSASGDPTKALDRFDLFPTSLKPEPNMVYCGKPSGSCHACRERKTKCDKIPEGCTQCKRVKRKCPGYRPQNYVIFRDQSSDVFHKFQTKEERRNKVIQEIIANSSATLEEDVDLKENLKRGQEQDCCVLTRSLVPNMEDRAIGFFVANFVLGISGPSHGHLDYLVDVYRTHVPDESLLCAMTAVGLAGFAHAEHVPTLFRNARHQYLRAVQLINETLADSVNVKKDTTLLTIMILGHFETITGCTRQSLTDWANHLTGAAAVIKLRGPDQITYPAGRRMLFQLTGNLLIPCIHRGIALPDSLREYFIAAYELVDDIDLAVVMIGTLMHFSDLRASIMNGTLSNPQEIISRALEFDRGLLQKSTQVRSGWEYETVYTDDESELVYNGHYHVYYDYWVAQIWNGSRGLRILLHELICQVLRRGLATTPIISLQEDAVQLQVSTDIMYDMQLDILRSVPQHRNYFPEPNSYSEATGSCLARQLFAKNKELASVRMSGGSFLLWPLWFVGDMDIATEEVRKFVVSNLRSIGSSFGIQQANLLAEMVQFRDKTRVWKE